MIFKPELIQKILSGEKTVTRRPLKAGEYECRYKVGRTYALQPGRGQRAVGRILVKAATPGFLEELRTTREARLEGFESVGDFLAYWARLYGEPVYLNQPVWRIRFERADA